jgi:hypothetical protein
MPILIVNLPGNSRGLVLRDRALIGRRPFNTIVVPDPTVSRIHAWIGTRDGRHVLFDAGSRAGTRVNGSPVSAPRVLADRDEIGVGPAMIEYRDADELPAHVEPIDSAPPSPVADPYDGGIYFDCSCGGPMWVNADLAGAAGKCRYCGKRLVVPHVSGQTARPLTPTGEPPKATAPRPAPAAPAPTVRETARPAPPARPVVAPPPAPPIIARAPQPPRPAPPPAPPAPAEPAPQRMAAPAPPPVETPPPVAVPTEEPPASSTPETPREVTHCSICQTAIADAEERTTCPSCGLEFHAACWQENYGCSAYGCDQVNVLAPPEAREPAVDQALQGEAGFGDPFPDSDADALPTFPWESVLLALSFVAMFLSALGFGVPSAVMLLGALVFLLVGRAHRKSLVLVAIVVSLAGAVAGYGMSMFWWRGVRVWEALLK